MSLKILLIGKKSFIANNLYKKLKKKNVVNIKDYKNIINKPKLFFKKYNFIINCSIDKRYISRKYKLKFDRDYSISKKIYNMNLRQIFLSTRKVYKSKANILEKDKIDPKCSYAKNKLITEKKLIKLMGDKLLIFRISNLIGYTKYNLKKKHKTFIDIFFENINNNVIFQNGSAYKDFVHINKFCMIIESAMKKKIHGVYNLSIGKKILLNRMISWLNTHNKNKNQLIFKKNTKSESFYLNNKKLKSKINIKYNVSDLKKDCEKLSKQFFKNI